MAKEIEILVPVLSTEEACGNALSPFTHGGTARTVDTYFYDPQREDLKPNQETGRILACMRVRTRDGEQGGYIAYKSDNFDGDEWLYSDEYETRVDDAETAKEIVRKLGLKVLTIVDCEKSVYATADGSKEIVFEKVAGLGNFLEVESKVAVADHEAATAKEGLRKFIRDELHLEFGEELNSGKPELMLQKQGRQPLEV